MSTQKISVCAAVVLASAAAATATGEPRAIGQDGTTRPRAAAQARTLVKYIVSGSIEIPAAAGTGYFDRGLAVDSAGNIYVGHNNLSTSGPDIAVLDPSGRLLRQWSAAPFGDGPVIAIGPDGLVYVQNNAETFVRVFTPDGVELVGRRMQHGAVNTKDLEVDGAGNVYVVARGRGDGGPYSDDGVYRFSSAGQLTGYLVPRPGEGPDEALAGIAVAADGSVYITAYGGQGSVLLFHLDAAGNKLPVFDPSFFLPGIYYDVEFANGRLYFSGPLRGPAQTDHTRVAAAVFSPQGELIDFTVGTLAEPNRLQQLAVHAGNMYVRLGAPQASSRPLAQSGGSITRIDGIVPRPSNQTTAFGVCDREGDRPSVTGGPNGRIGTPPILVGRGRGNCEFVFINRDSPCFDDEVAVPKLVKLGGQDLPRESWHYNLQNQSLLILIGDSRGSGTIVALWTCINKASGAREDRWERKGEIELIDPSGNVVDTRTNRPVEAATVRLQFSPRQSGPFVDPAPSTYRPQVNPQETGRTGFFGWDVALGFWRLKVNAFGYRSFTSVAYRVPPERTGLKLRLRPNPRQQRLLIDPYAGRVGSVRLGSRLPKGRRVAGLGLRVVRGRVRSITVRSRSFRTAHGIKLRSTGLELLLAYPARSGAIGQAVASAPSVVRHRVGKATFTVRRGRVVGIQLGR